MSVYKGENVIAGGSVDTHFVRKPAWSQAVAVASADLVAGYAAPADGMIVGQYYSNGTSATNALTVNDVEVAITTYNTINAHVRGNVQVQVNKNDVIKLQTALGPASNISFVPFEDSTVSDVEVVTPEYIRNQNILSDYESVTLASSAGAANTAQYDGFLSVVWPNPAGSGTVYVSQDGGSSWISDLFKSDKASSGGGYDTLTIPLRKGDKYYFAASTSISAIVAKARYYKLRDYRGR